MPNMSGSVEQRRQAEYAPKADFETLAAEIRGFREATEARLDARYQVLVRMERTLERIDQRFDDLDTRHRATFRWIIGSALASGCLFLAALRFGQTGVG